jgi:2,3-bisphosphoglycerate-dependent phosphoglycerate mutase
MKLNIYLFKHGELASRRNILCGWINLPLSKKGLNSSKILSEKLRGEKIDFAFCSDLLRSQQNLVEVLKYHLDAKIVIDPRLRERHFGALSCELESIFADTSALQTIGGGTVEGVPGLESMDTLRKRIFPFMSDVLRLMQEEKVNVAISAHTKSSRFIQEYLEGLLPDEVKKIEQDPSEYKKYVVNFD